VVVAAPFRRRRLHAARPAARAAAVDAAGGPARENSGSEHFLVHDLRGKFVQLADTIPLVRIDMVDDRRGRGVRREIDQKRALTPNFPNFRAKKRARRPFFRQE
jgi:hypothetical protein